MLVHENQNQKNLKAIENALTQMFPVETDNFTLHLDEVKPQVPDVNDLGLQKQYKLEGRTFNIPINAKFTLHNKTTGKKQSGEFALMNVPAMTQRGTYLINGTEYQIVNQFKLKPGIYVYRPKFIEDPEAYFNFAGKGKNFRIVNQNGVISLKIDASHIPLYPYLREQGITHSQIENAWGSDVVEKNKDEAISASKREKLLMLAGKENVLLPEVTKITLGKEYKSLVPDAILEASRKVINILKGKVDPDRRDALYFKHVLDDSDLLYDRMQLSTPKIKQRMVHRMEKYRQLPDAIDFSMFNKPVYQLMLHSKLSEVPSEVNPIIRDDAFAKVTPMGEGGIQDLRSISLHTRNVDPSFLGFVDPIHSPEGPKVGVTQYFTPNVIIKNREPYIMVVDNKTGKEVEVRPIDLKDKWIAFEKPHSPTEAMRNEVIKKIPGNEVDYYLPDVSDIFSVSSMMIPYINTNQAVRGMVASKIMGQTLPLKYRESPRIQNGYKGKTVEKMMGDAEALFSPADGIVSKISDDHVYIDSHGKSIKVPYYNNFPLNKNSMEHHELTIKTGDKVKKGQLLADSIFTRDGDIALGVNLKAAIVPYRGFTFEDGVVISEDAAKKLTSYHMYENSLSKSEEHVFNKDKYVAYYPGDMTEENLNKLDSQGVTKKGVVVTQGDVILAGLRPKIPTSDEIALGKLSRSLLKDYSRDILTWDRDVPGTVLHVAKNPDEMAVYIRTEEPARVGDKLSNSCANKTIITKIVPTNEMLKNENGEPLEILYDPLGIPSRINLGQLLEMGMQKVLDKQGKHKTVIPKFTTDNTKNVLALMRQHNVPEKERLYDPVDGRWLDNPIFTGKQHILKLEHKVNTKFSARGLGPDYDENLAPVSGGESGAKSLDRLTLYSMLAHGAKHNLQEMATLKSQANPEIWRMIQMGYPAPTTKPTFAFQKFQTLLRGMGIDVRRNDNQLQLVPFTDDMIKNLSNGEIKDPEAMVRGKDLEPIKGGLVDPFITGGHRGEKWSHFNLATELPNPTFEGAILAITGLTAKDYREVLEGRKQIEDIPAKPIKMKKIAAPGEQVYLSVTKGEGGQDSGPVGINVGMPNPYELVDPRDPGKGVSTPADKAEDEPEPKQKCICKTCNFEEKVIDNKMCRRFSCPVCGMKMIGKGE